MRIAFTIATLGLALAVAPAAAQATDIHFEVRLADRAASCGEGDEFGLAFDMVWPRGTLLGTGQSCVHETVDRCVPFRPFCRVTRDATFTLHFARRGTVTAPMTLREAMPTESSFLQRGMGRVASGSGEFAGARGHVKGGGTIEFTEDGVVTAVGYRVHLR